MDKRTDKLLIEIAKEIKGIKSLTSYQKEQVSDIIQNLNNREFRITVVGEFSSGKSTFLNAIIGKDILPHGVKETTATVTYIHNVSKTDQRIDKAYIHFNNGDDDISVDLTKNALVDYVTTSENKYKVIEEISSVDIYVHFVETEENILIIDTPGMNGMAEGHQALTIKEIQQSHASICLFPIRGIGDSDFQFLKELITYQNTFFFILNRIDEINTTEGETYEERIDIFRKELCNCLYDGRKDVKYAFGISALKALVARDYSIEKLYEDSRPIDSKKEREKLLKESRIEIFEQELYNYLNNSEKETELYLLSVERLLRIIEPIKESMIISKKVYETQNENLPEKKRLDELEKRLLSIYEKTKENIAILLNAGIKDLEDEIIKSTQNDCENKQQEINNKIQSLDFESAKQVIENKRYNSDIDKFWYNEKNRISEKITIGTSEIYENVLIDLEKRLPNISFQGEKISFKFNITDDFEKTDYGYNTEIERLEQEKKKLEQDLMNRSKAESVDDAKKKLNAVNNAIRDLQNDKYNRIQYLGARPSVEYKTETYTEKVKTGFWTRFFTLGIKRYKEETRTRTVIDDSAQRKYDERRQSIENDFYRKITQKESERAKIENLYEKAQSNDLMKKRLEREIENLKQQINEEKAQQEELIKVAKTTALREFKKNLLNMVNDLLSVPKGQLYVNLYDGIHNNLNNCLNEMKHSLNDLYERKITEFTETIKISREKLNGEVNVAESNKKINNLKSEIELSNELINKLNIIKNELQNRL